jgi:hypothetical protein
MKTILLKLLLLIVSFSFYLTGSSQDVNNRISITSAPISWSLTTAAQLETEQQISNAITLHTYSSNNSGYRVFVRISNMTNTSGTPMPASMNKMQLFNQNSSNQVTAVTTKITLSQTNQLLITDANRTNNTGDLFYYTAFFGPVGYDYAPGTYTFTVLYTMTQP